MCLPLVDLLLVVVTQYLIQTNGRVFAGGRDADIGARHLVSGVAKAKRKGSHNNHHDGVGGRITQPLLLKGLFGKGMRVLQGSGGSGHATSGHTVVTVKRRSRLENSAHCFTRHGQLLINLPRDGLGDGTGKGVHGCLLLCLVVN